MVYERLRIYVILVYQMTQKYSDDLQESGVEVSEVAATSAQDLDSDEEILSETRTLTGGFEKNKTKHKCLKRVCKGTLILTATVMFTVMLVQLWTNYGDYIENRVFSPTVVAAGTFDREGDVTTYVMEFHKWDNNTLHMTLDVPENPLLQIETPYNWAEWGDGCLKVNTVYENVSVVVWSLWSK